MGSRRSTRSCAPRSGGCRATAGGSPGLPPASTWRSRKASWTTSTGSALSASKSATSSWSGTAGSWSLPGSRDEIDAIIAKKHEELDDPDMVKLYRLLSQALDWSVEDPRIVEIADILERLMIRAVEAGEVANDDFDDHSSTCWTRHGRVRTGRRAAARDPEERGWKGWTRIERVPADRAGT